MRNSRQWLMGLAGLYAAILIAESAAAMPEFVKQLKEMGYPIQDCQYCHLDRAPK